MGAVYRWQRVRAIASHENQVSALKSAPPSADDGDNLPESVKFSRKSSWPAKAVNLHLLRFAGVVGAGAAKRTRPRAGTTGRVGRGGKTEKFASPGEKKVEKSMRGAELMAEGLVFREHRGSIRVYGLGTWPTPPCS
jgi:hypothetical protein